MVEGFITYGNRTEFCTKPDGTMTSQHEFKVTSVERKFDFEYAVLTCVCGQTINGSRVAKVGGTA